MWPVPLDKIKWPTISREVKQKQKWNYKCRNDFLPEHPGQRHHICKAFDDPSSRVGQQEVWMSSIFFHGDPGCSGDGVLHCEVASHWNLLEMVKGICQAKQINISLVAIQTVCGLCTQQVLIMHHVHQYFFWMIKAFCRTVVLSGPVEEKAVPT